VRCHECHRLLTIDSLLMVDHPNGTIWLCSRCRRNTKG
jgi:hypothetical protein